MTKRRARPLRLRPESPFRVRSVSIRPGDTIVLRTELVLDKDTTQSLRDRATEQFPGYKVAILTGGLELAVLRRGKRT
jgi:hypothetical protein